MLSRTIQIQKYTNTDLFLGHYLAYHKFAEYSELDIIYTKENKSQFSIPYSETNTDWNNRTPYNMCDKSKNQAIFKEAGFDTLETSIYYSQRILPEYNYIVKPISGAGSISKLRGTYEINPKVVDLACRGTHIIQKSIVSPGEEYIQLYVEGFINTQSMVEFTSVHEIVFCDNVWIRQLDTKITFELLQILNKLKAMIISRNIGNCMFLLQFLRKPTEYIWYPTDWQYRLSYNTVFGKSAIEPEYCKSAVQFMVGNKNTVIPQKFKYYQGTVPIKDNFLSKIKETNTVIVPSKPKQKNCALIITHGNTFEEAKNTFEYMLS